MLSLPDFARGAGQNVDVSDAPSTYGTALSQYLPVSLSDTSGVTSVSVTLDYNAALLDVSSVQLAPGLPGDWGVSFDNSTLGQLVITASGTTALSAGAADIADIVASVPASAAASYGASAVLSLANAQVNSGAIAVTTDRAIEKAVYFGDATGDGTLSGLDASYISRNSANLDDGFSAYPLTDPRIVADVTGDGTLSGMDACYTAQKSVELSIPQIPDLPAHGPLTAATIDPTLSAQLGVVGTPGSTALVPISISDDANGVLSADFTITYDSSRLSITNADVTLSSYLIGQDWGIAKNTTAAGQVLLSLYATDQGALPTGTPQLVNLNFHVASNAQAGTIPIGLTVTQNQSVNQKGFNEGNLATSFSNGSVVIPATVANEYIFYNNSKFDANNPAANISDYNAIATDKTALLPGGAATFANYTSYSRGINGLLIDFANLPPSTILSASDFQFKVGNNNTPSGWANAPAPQTVATWVGPNGDLFADIVWTDNQIQDQWLQVTVKADANTQLAADKVFYFGNEIGDTGIGNTATKAIVTAPDVSAIQANPATSLHPAPITNAYDLNRDGLVNAADVTIAQTNLNSTLSPTALTLISPPSAPAALTATGTSQGLSMVTATAQPAGCTVISDAVITASSMPAATSKLPQSATVDHIFAELKTLGLGVVDKLETLLESSSTDSWASSLEADLENLAQHLISSRSRK